MSDLKINFEAATFLTSAPNISHMHMPADLGYEIAFAGRSNAGKSSALNTITRQKNLARTSKTPGRTQLINIFSLDPQRRLIDLPGYGFAKVPLDMKLKWQKSLSEYLQSRDCLRGLVIMMDIRHPLKDLDVNMIRWAVESDLPVLGLLTKCDKLKSGARKAAVLKARKDCEAYGGDITIQAFSSLKVIGKSEAIAVMNKWLQQDEELVDSTELNEDGIDE
ncbi:ribosome biogenesis GTP-binding protein YihA/YsxC [Psychrobium sp. 1_MG-2023]|uniref:ribosome biogenesis GTP-binding protein YihA/YsxC n=1 Tax=Psychrobium sp. 1_MG-2023 TaxID=3062624 RepID=UPI000C3273B9|nr:ribosome biogenesis GTP-binding protein YihA/YsxC [Psychrobium sp. 1_MG-2023]MDP2561029.1 ribosome biogenesis GTP-binding protein YihA/YsxC [Psychrobium sp. 1_MG-2023]PKF58322.1 YihA family ribosome biogenesis GTP-binding protein [Alteromonadales bacterium alter-6D02]